MQTAIIPTKHQWGFSCLSVPYSAKLQMHSVKPQVIKFQLRSISNDVIYASASKVLTSTVCYPLESIRLLLLSNSDHKQLSKKPLHQLLSNLYSGYSHFLPYHLIHNLVTYNILFRTIKFMGTYELAYSDSLLVASIFTSVLTSLYKFPLTYVIRRKIISKDVCLKKLQNIRYVSKAIAAMLMEDIPDIYIKMYLNYKLTYLFPTMSHVYISVVTGLISCILLTPFEMIKTKIIYVDVKLVDSSLAFYMKLLISILSTTLFFTFTAIIKSQFHICNF